MARCTRYNVMLSKFVSDLRRLCGFLGLPQLINLTAVKIPKIKIKVDNERESNSHNLSGDMHWFYG